MNCLYCNTELKQSELVYSCDCNVCPQHIRYFFDEKNSLRQVNFRDRKLKHYNLIVLNYKISRTTFFIYQKPGDRNHLLQYMLPFILDINPGNYEHYINKYRRLINFK